MDFAEIHFDFKFFQCLLEALCFFDVVFTRVIGFCGWLLKQVQWRKFVVETALLLEFRLFNFLGLDNLDAFVDALFGLIGDLRLSYWGC